MTGGQFRVESIDPQRDEILLARNDRYWGEPAKPDLILFRRGGAPAALADSIRNGDTQVAQVHGGAAAFAQLSAIPDVRTARIVTPARHAADAARAAAELWRIPKCARRSWVCSTSTCWPRSGPVDDNTVTLAQAQVRSPVGPGLRADRSAGDDSRRRRWDCWPTPGTDRARGHHRHRRTTREAAPENNRGQLTKDGEPLTLVIGVAANDPTSVAVANTAADQLRNVGIAAIGVGAGPGDALRRRAGQQPRRRGGRLASGRRRPRDCAGVALRLPRAGGDGGRRPPRRRRRRRPPTSSTPSSTSPRPEPPGDDRHDPPRRRSPAQLVQAPSNITGICDRSIQPKIDAALRRHRRTSAT